jgi:hypothetical protein
MIELLTRPINGLLHSIDELLYRVSEAATAFANSRYPLDSVGMAQEQAFADAEAECEPAWPPADSLLSDDEEQWLVDHIRSIIREELQAPHGRELL